MPLSSNVVSATVRPMGPTTGNTVHPCGRRSVGTKPGVGRNPTTPQNAAGLRNDPPASVPWQIGTIPVASATADPPDEPARQFPVFGPRPTPTAAPPAGPRKSPPSRPPLLPAEPGRSHEPPWR